MSDHDWLTLHRVKFKDEIDGRGNPMPGPKEADIWRFAPESPIGDDGLRTSVSDVWGGFALYPDKSSAQQVFDSPAEHLPFLGDTVEAWHALVIPFAHRGGVQWRAQVEYDSAIRPSPKDPKGPLVVLTSAGYDNPGPEDSDRIKRFMKGIDDVLEYYGTLPGNIRRAVFTGSPVDGREGATLTLWHDDKSMITGAYRPGGHKAQLEVHEAEPLFDRSSFSRGRVIASSGTWAGGDPIAEWRGDLPV